MNAGGSAGTTIILIDQPSTPIFGDLNHAQITGLISAPYGRYHDPFLNIPLSVNALPLIDPGSSEAPPMWCTGRDGVCDLNNDKYIDGRLDRILELNKGQPVYPQLTRHDGHLVFPHANGGPVDPIWYDWTTTTTVKPSFVGVGDDANSTTTTEPASVEATTAVSTDPALNPDPYFANNCTCEYEVDNEELAMTLVFSAGASSILTGLLCTQAWRGQSDPAGSDTIWELHSLGTDESFEQMLAE